MHWARGSRFHRHGWNGASAECMEPRMFDSTTSDEFDAVNGVATLAEARAKAMFDRVLVGWASDLLHLRRQGLNEPGWREQVEGQDGPEWRRAA